MEEWNPILDFVAILCVADYFLQRHREDVDEFLGLVSLILLGFCFITA